MFNNCQINFDGFLHILGYQQEILLDIIFDDTRFIFYKRYLASF